MDLHAKLDALIELAGETGLEVRREVLGGGGGGLCVLKGRRVLFVDLAADVETRYERTLESMAELKELDERYLPPELRDDIDRQREARR